MAYEKRLRKDKISSLYLEVETRGDLEDRGQICLGRKRPGKGNGGESKPAGRSFIYECSGKPRFECTRVSIRLNAHILYRML